ncbi:MAG TPA: patatin-like phospholipase family protein [Ilumatobacteraceae bacterium]
MARIGVAVSGGGYRATTWGLGALLYLVDAGKHREVTTISSVSGGSVANGLVAHETEFRTTDPERFRAALHPLLRHMAYDGLIFFGAATNAYVFVVLACAALTALALVATLVGVVAAALDALGVFEISWIAAAIGWSVAAFAVLAVIAFLLFRWRSLVVERAMAKKFFRRSGKATKLSALPMPSAQPDSVPLHVFCATELQQGQQLYATPEFVYTYAYGLGVPGDLSLARAVQCSACLPGGFAPRFLRTDQHRFPKADVPKRMVLSDGGVYDNMADQWETGRANRPLADDRFPAADELIVVNASAAATTLATKTRLLGAELFGLKRPIDVMYDITTKMRRFELVEDWNAAERSGRGQRGTLVHIPQSPFVVAERLARLGTPAQQARANAVLPLIPGTKEEWAATAAASTGVRTTLGKLGADVVARLLLHSYVLAMVNSHVVLGYPLLEFPRLADMERLVGTS